MLGESVGGPDGRSRTTPRGTPQSPTRQKQCHPGQARSAPIRDQRLGVALPAAPDLRFAMSGMTPSRA